MGASEHDGHASTFLLREIPDLHWSDKHSVVHIEPLIHEVLQTPVGIYLFTDTLTRRNKCMLTTVEFDPYTQRVLWFRTMFCT